MTSAFRIRPPTAADAEAVTELVVAFRQTSALVVDSWNRTGAKSVYERLGMREERVHSRFEKEVLPGA